MRNMSLFGKSRFASQSFRAKRVQRLLSEAPLFMESRVIDLGGSLDFWGALEHKPHDLTLLNLESEVSEDTLGINLVTMDVQELTSSYLAKFDFIFSNSLIEHLGGFLQRKLLATRIIESKKPFWIQTPYRYFPLEPHWQFPAVQFMPIRIQAGISQHIPWGHMKLRNSELAVEEALMLDSISKTELRHLFPEAVLINERIAGLTKSLVAFYPGENGLPSPRKNSDSEVM